MSTNNPMLFLGAAFIGIVSAAGVYIAEHIRQERKRQAMVQDLARLDQQMAGMKKELELLRQLQKEKFFYNNFMKPSFFNVEVACQPDLTYKKFIRKAQNLRKLKNVERRRITSPTISEVDDYSSAVDMDSSDLEFYDLSDEETISTVTPIEQVLKDIDDKLNSLDTSRISSALQQLTELLEEFAEGPDILWRIGKAHHKLSTASTDVAVKKEHVEKGLDACQRALDINSNIGEAHKWYGILVGSRSKWQAINDKIKDGWLFKQHIDEAVRLSPEDATLHHMLGRFAFETASLKWYERKIATTFFGEVPQATFDEALKHFRSAERLSASDWKENKLLIAKCHIALQDYKSAIEALELADKTQNDTMDIGIDAEIRTLLDKYNGYR